MNKKKQKKSIFSRNFEARLQSKRGFTLIELLIVVAVIGLLASVFVSVAQEVRERGRNATRITHVRQLYTAMQLAYDSETAYAFAANPVCASQACPGWGTSPSATFDNWLAKTLDVKPKAPPGPFPINGYMYRHDGSRWPQLNYLQEGLPTPNICGPGRIMGSGSAAGFSWTLCTLFVDTCFSGSC